MEGLEASFLEVGQVATELGASAGLWVGNFLVLIILTAVIYMFTMRKGGAVLIAFNLALYIGYAIYIVFPYKDAVIGIGATPLVSAVLAVLLFAVATAPALLLALRLTPSQYGRLSIFQSFPLSLLAATFLMALGYHVFDIANIYTFPEPVNQLFEPEGFFFYWFVAPLIGLWFLAR
jgi:hypothetical protein